ncbi:hypothetical protein [uncultured Butyricimonas sp.]|uniref:hypothetical protein n=1 Tax=uncultured Butyricimonas sp. TaxID=1268785 RepID=UPI0026DDAC47|nr:hypothetical protein [uncultured Butyricimonas sp.]
MSDNISITKSEKQWIEELSRLLKRQPKTITIFCSPGEIELYSKKCFRGTDGRVMKDKEITSIPYCGDCGAH